MTKPSHSMKSRLGELLANRTALSVAVALGAIVVAALLIGLPVASAGSPAYTSRYEQLAQRYDELQSSVHKGLPCTACHVDRRGAVIHDAALVGDFYAGLVGRQKAPLFSTFETPTREACLACHATDWSMESTRTVKVPHPAHLRVASETRDCMTCHKWTAHEETTQQKHMTMPFSGVCVAYGCHVGTKQTGECANCHHSLAKGDWKKEHRVVVEAAGANGCLESCHEIAQCRQCHTTGKKPDVAGPAVQTGLQTIQTLHVQADWLQKHGAVAQTDQSQCMKCHVSDGQCRECHSRRPAFHGSTATWIGTHKDVSKNNEQRCTGTCHEKKFCDDCHKQFKEMR